MANRETATRYFLYQMEPNGHWIPQLARFRSTIIEDKRPFLTTALDVSSDFSEPEQNTAEFFSQLTYWGDFYADFDGKNGKLETVIKDLNQYLDNLAAKGVDLNTLKLWATGGRGFHVTLAPTAFVETERRNGTRGLPLIYREMALGLVVDTLDMAVYSTRKGRMWRTENVKRENGLYKVRITLDEARRMTPDLYTEVCSNPRHMKDPPAPTVVPGMAALYSSACDKLALRIKNAGKSKADKSLIAKFNGKVPPTIASVMAGEGIKAGVGFNQIAIQLSATAHALGLKLDDYISQCEGLCQKHSGDGLRYDTPAKRRAELTRLYHYTQDYPGFEFMVGPIKNMLAEGVKSLDLDGVSERALNQGNDSGSDTEEAEAEIGADEKEVSAGLRLTKYGIRKHTEDGIKLLCSVGITQPAMLMDSITGKTIGYEVNMYCDGVYKGSRLIPIHTFAGRQKFINFCLDEAGASMSGTDLDVAALAEVLRLRASREGKHVYVVGREGLDFVRPPGAKYKHGTCDRIYMTANPETCISADDQMYRFKPILTVKPVFGANLMEAPDLTDTEESRRVIDGLLSIQTEAVVSRLLGWYSACFLRQGLHEIRKQFPLLHVYGEAGTGKTATNIVFGYLHTYTVPPKELQAGGTTPFALRVAMASSASIPLILDEWKPRSDTGRGRYPTYRGYLRACYTQGSTAQGTLDPGGGGTDTREASFSAPVCFIGEAIEMETALLHRCVVTPIKVVASATRRDTFLHVTENTHIISGLGKVLAKLALATNMEVVRGFIKEYEVDYVMPRMMAKNVNMERTIYNYAAILVGLDFVNQALGTVFGSRYVDRIKELKEALLDSLNVQGVAASAVSEVSKVINTLAQLSHDRDDPRVALVRGVDYDVGDGWVEIKLKTAFSKYAKHIRAVGGEKLFDNEEAFVGACGNYHAVVDKACSDSPLKAGPFTVVYRFANTGLDADQIETFDGSMRN